MTLVAMLAVLIALVGGSFWIVSRAIKQQEAASAEADKHRPATSIGASAAPQGVARSDAASSVTTLGDVALQERHGGPDPSARGNAGEVPAASATPAVPPVSHPRNA